MILEEIVRHKRNELAQFKSRKPLNILKDTIRELPPARDFKKALLQSSSPNASKSISIIAEVKKASPSRGVIRSDFNPVEIAMEYQENGAVAISVLTDKKYFQGELDYLKQIKEVTNIPILDKDFIIDVYQIYQARIYGADAVLLIAAILTDNELSEYLTLTNQLSLDTLVEVHTLEELNRVLNTDAQIIGINNRDLKSFLVNTDTSVRLAKYIPDDKMVVSERGINSKEIISSLQKEGIDAFLIGEALMKEKDIGKKLRELVS
ncbi:MAG: indole-3-glycerol phosphate synthase TrpC [Deltaproteobacteria bacterium]|nr:indole-3-glycerol phosphate synthase TrpC [Deltaproteobacteria bacterium]